MLCRSVQAPMGVRTAPLHQLCNWWVVAGEELLNGGVESLGNLDGLANHSRTVAALPAGDLGAINAGLACQLADRKTRLTANRPKLRVELFPCHDYILLIVTGFLANGTPAPMWANHPSHLPDIRLLSVGQYAAILARFQRNHPFLGRAVEI